MNETRHGGALSVTHAVLYYCINNQTEQRIDRDTHTQAATVEALIEMSTVPEEHKLAVDSQHAAAAAEGAAADSAPPQSAGVREVKPR